MLVIQILYSKFTKCPQIKCRNLTENRRRFRDPGYNIFIPNRRSGRLFNAPTWMKDPRIADTDAQILPTG